MIASVDVSIQSTGEDYRRAVIELQAATEHRLNQNRSQIEEISKQLTGKQMQLEELQAHEKELKEMIDRLHSASKKIRDKKITLEKEKTSKEKDLESKKLLLNNEVLGLSNQLDRLQKDLQQLEFEHQSASRELEQAKGLVLQAVEQNRLMLLSLKKQHLEKLSMEDSRTASIKSGLTQYLTLKRK